MSSLRFHSLRSRPGFTLVEVVVAIGIFAVGIVAILGLFAPLAQSARVNTDTTAATNAAEILFSRLRGEPIAAVAGYLKSPAELLRDEGESASDPTEDDRIFYVNLAGTKVGHRHDSVWGGSDREKYFEIALIRNEELSPVGDDAFAAWLAFNARIRWPVGAGSPAGGSNPGGRQMLFFSGSIRR